MAAKKKSAAKKSVKKKAAKRAPQKKTKAAPAKRSAKKVARRVRGASVPAGGLVLHIAPALEARLRMLATKMGKTLPQAAAQALDEFVETWEDHMQTVAALKESEDRVHLSVPKE